MTSKLGNDAHEHGEARQALDETPKALGTRYVDQRCRLSASGGCTRVAGRAGG